MLLDRAAVIEFDHENPKTVGTKSNERYEIYKVAKTVGHFLDLGGLTADLRFDASHKDSWEESGAVVATPRRRKPRLFVGHLPSDDLILMITTSCPQSPGRERGGFRHGDASLDLLAQSVPLRRPHDRHELSSFRRPSKKTVLFTCLTKGSSSSVAMNEVATLLPSSRSAPREKSAARTTPVSSIAGLSRNNMSLLL
jgi:hypothetical protein